MKSREKMHSLLLQHAAGLPVFILGYIGAILALLSNGPIWFQFLLVVIPSIVGLASNLASTWLKWKLEIRKGKKHDHPQQKSNR
jgi:hypothetical protein